MFDAIKTSENLFLYILAWAILLAAIVVLLMAVHTFWLMRNSLAKQNGGPEKSMASSLWSGLTRAVPLDKEQTVMLNHEYDGIRELDNHLPPWWTGLFALTVVFAVFYVAIYHGWGSAPLQAAEYENEMSIAQQETLAYEAKHVEQIDENNAKLMLDNTATVTMGQQVFEGRCAACHGQKGEGTVGPNLTDEYWLHGDGSIKEIFKVVKNGVPEKGMIAWKGSLKPKEIEAVSNYIISIKGSKPANGKEPQGNKI